MHSCHLYFTTSTKKYKFNSYILLDSCNNNIYWYLNLFYFHLLWMVFKNGYKSINQFYDNVPSNASKCNSKYCDRIASIDVSLRLFVYVCVCVYVSCRCRCAPKLRCMCVLLLIFRILLKRMHFMISIKIVFNALASNVFSMVERLWKIQCNPLWEWHWMHGI